ncbi:hypothetical protein [Rhodocaloribacter sp.]
MPFSSFLILGAYLMRTSLTGFLWLGVGLLSLVAAACREAQPVEQDFPPEDPPLVEETPFVEFRSWTAPRRIEVAPDPGPYHLYPHSLSTEGLDGLHLLFSFPVDTLHPSQKLRLGYLRYDGNEWSLQGEIDGDGWLHPAPHIVDGAGELHVFFGGVLPEERAAWLERTIFSPHLFYCRWNATGCTAPTVLVSQPAVAYKIAFGDTSPVLDSRGRIQIIVEKIDFDEILTLDPGGTLLSRSRVEGGDHHLLVAGDTLHRVYVAASKVLGVANDLYYTYRLQGGWAEAVTIFHDVSRRGFLPVLAIDPAGVFHVVYYADGFERGTFTVEYTRSDDRGLTWSRPEVLGTIHGPFYRAPKLLADRYGVLHVFWNQVLLERLSNGGFGVKNSYRALREGVWEPPRFVFPGFELQIEAKAVLDGRGVVHVIFLALDGHIYHATFE